jgi:hypothetical protein
MKFDSVLHGLNTSNELFHLAEEKPPRLFETEQYMIGYQQPDIITL